MASVYDRLHLAVYLIVQMRFMRRALSIVHNKAAHLPDADYFLRLGADLSFGPIYK